MFKRLKSLVRRRTVVRGATSVFAAMICVLTLTPMRPAAVGIPASDKTYHIIACAALVLPMALLYRPWLVSAFVGALFLGAAIEVVQPFVERSANLWDFYADYAGAIVGVIFGTMLRYPLDHFTRRKQT